MRKQKILFISYDGMTDPLGQSQVIPYLKGLSDLGHRITILSCEKKANFEKKRAIIGRQLDESGIEWSTILYTKKPPLLSTIYDVIRLKLRAKKLHSIQEFSVVHCRSYLSALIGLYFKKKYQTSFIFDMRGFWADERVDGDLWSLTNPIYLLVYKFFKRKERDFLELSESIVSLTHNGKNEIIHWDKDYSHLPIKVIPCCVDTDLFSQKTIENSRKMELRSNLGIGSDDFVLTYLGSIGTWYMLEEMLDFYEVLLAKDQSAKFLFISPVDSHEAIFSGLEGRSFSRDQIVTVEASRNEVPLYLSIANYSIFFIKPSYSKKSSSPTKQGELMSMGIPVICNSGVGDTDLIVEKYQSGLLVKSFNKEHYKESIEKLVDTEFNPDQIRNGALEYFSLENGIKKYNEILRELSI